MSSSINAPPKVQRTQSNLGDKIRHLFGLEIPRSRKEQFLSTGNLATAGGSSSNGGHRDPCSGPLSLPVGASHTQEDVTGLSRSVSSPSKDKSHKRNSSQPSPKSQRYQRNPNRSNFAGGVVGGAASQLIRTGLSVSQHDLSTAQALYNAASYGKLNRSSSSARGKEKSARSLSISRYDHVSRSTSGHSNSGSTSNANRKQPLAPSQKIRRTGLHSWFGSNPQLPWRTESESAGRRREDSEYSASRSLSQSRKREQKSQSKSNSKNKKKESVTSRGSSCQEYGVTPGVKPSPSFNEVEMRVKKKSNIQSVYTRHSIHFDSIQHALSGLETLDLPVRKKTWPSESFKQPQCKSCSVLLTDNNTCYGRTKYPSHMCSSSGGIDAAQSCDRIDRCAAEGGCEGCGEDSGAPVALYGKQVCDENHLGSSTSCVVVAQSSECHRCCNSNSSHTTNIYSHHHAAEEHLEKEDGTVCANAHAQSGSQNHRAGARGCRNNNNNSSVYSSYNNNNNTTTRRRASSASPVHNHHPHPYHHNNSSEYAHPRAHHNWGPGGGDCKGGNCVPQDHQCRSSHRRGASAVSDHHSASIRNPRDAKQLEGPNSSHNLAAGNSSSSTITAASGQHQSQPLPAEQQPPSRAVEGRLGCGCPCDCSSSRDSALECVSRDLLPPTANNKQIFNSDDDNSMEAHSLRHLWNGVSGVPGLGISVQCPNSLLSLQEWDKHATVKGWKKKTSLTNSKSTAGGSSSTTTNNNNSTATSSTSPWSTALENAGKKENGGGESGGKLVELPRLGPRTSLGPRASSARSSGRSTGSSLSHGQSSSGCSSSKYSHRSDSVFSSTQNRCCHLSQLSEERKPPQQDHHSLDCPPNCHQQRQYNRDKCCPSCSTCQCPSGGSFKYRSSSSGDAHSTGGATYGSGHYHHQQQPRDNSADGHMVVQRRTARRVMFTDECSCDLWEEEMRRRRYSTSHVVQADCWDDVDDDMHNHHQHRSAHNAASACCDCEHAGNTREDDPSGGHHYQTPKEVDGDYSYAYSDSVSPAFLIRINASLQATNGGNGGHNGNNGGAPAYDEQTENIYEEINEAAAALRVQPPSSMADKNSAMTTNGESIRSLFQKAKESVRRTSKILDETKDDTDSTFHMSISKGRKKTLIDRAHIDWDDEITLMDRDDSKSKENLAIKGSNSTSASSTKSGNTDYSSKTNNDAKDSGQGSNSERENSVDTRETVTSTSPSGEDTQDDSGFHSGGIEEPNRRKKSKSQRNGKSRSESCDKLKSNNNNNKSSIKDGGQSLRENGSKSSDRSAEHRRSRVMDMMSQQPHSLPPHLYGPLPPHHPIPHYHPHAPPSLPLPPPPPPPNHPQAQRKKSVLSRLVSPFLKGSSNGPPPPPPLNQIGAGPPNPQQQGPPQQVYAYLPHHPHAHPHHHHMAGPPGALVAHYGPNNNIDKYHADENGGRTFYL